MNYTKGRSRVVEWLRKQLIGPASGHEILRGISPLERYPTGVLFPIILGEDGVDPVSISDEEDDDYTGIGDERAETSDAEPAAKRRRYMPPSSVGFSFYACGEPVRFQVICAAAQYKRSGERDERGRFLVTEYERIELGGDTEALTFEARNSQTHKQFSQRKDMFDQHAGIDVLWRPFSDGWIVTVSLFNRQEWDVEGDPKSFQQDRNERSLFETELRCFLEAGEIGTYPCVDKSLLTDEEQELELQYKERRIYAVGHGAAVDWREEQGFVKEIRSEFLPAVEVPQVTADVAGDGNAVLGLAYLATGEDGTSIPNDVIEELDKFVEHYSAWVSGQEEASVGLDPDEQEAAVRITNRMGTALHRMKLGVSMLRTDHRAAKAFQLANQSMLNQMRQADRVRGKFREEREYKWRPFQLAFLLTVIESAVTEDDGFRDTVDLIWFPTGGGKTEAYLGLIAFLIVWRRFKYSASGGGTTAIMRYTLRLLTAQQYLRATRMICALELMRRRNSELGKEPITVGMWVGKATSPNTFRKAKEVVQQASEGRVAAQQRLVLDSCPWCGTAFKAPDSYISTPSKFHFRCVNPKCEFGEQGGEQLPCNVVDEALYDRPPTLLLATVDKFARLTWDERTNVFFGRKPNRPPELIIQDELHLIAGALGSVVGIYEAALDTVLVQRGVHPKYVASTATIRMAKQQVERLYGRELAIFPPPGLSSDDSYFAKKVDIDDEHPGRLYVGYLAPMLNRQHCMAPLVAALHVAPEAVFQQGGDDRDDLLEAWWTQVVYHGSLKGVGNSHNAFNIDVRDFVKRLTKELCSARKGSECDAHEVEKTVSRSAAQIAQLTGISSAEENARTFSRLERTREEVDCLDVVLATNMISVGLDVARLALMIINGQPLTTAEYIQASSRVGRSEVPGLVFANFYRDQARSLSHYENFRPYHDSFYRFVEPTSVTPYTYQARIRALHAALVIAIRHSCVYLLGNNQAGQFNPTDDCVRKVIDSLKRRCAQADPDRGKATASHIERVVEEWRSEAEHCKAWMVYQAPDNDKGPNRLLHSHDDRIKGLWATLQSMRNVENSALLKPLHLPVRLSHLLRHCSVGAIVRGPEYLMTVKDIREWTARDGGPAGELIPYVDQVRSALGIEQELREPPIAKELDSGQVEGICVPAVRFPTWMRCPGCGLLHSKPWIGVQAGHKPRCHCEKKPELEQVPWVLVHTDGHLADVPWHFLAHREGKGEKQQRCRADWEAAYLRLIDQGASSRRIVCSRCHAGDNFSDSLRINFGNRWRQPWIHEPPDAPDEATPSDPAVVLEINDTRVHSPVTCSALVIPPESRIRRGSVVDRLYCSSQKRQQIEGAGNRLSRKSALQTIAGEFRCSISELEEAHREIDNGYPLYGKQFTQGILLESEYQALIEEIPDLADDEDFVTEHHTSAWKRKALALSEDMKPLRVVKSIDHLIALNRLKEIMVLRGFQRLGGELIPPDISGGSSWLPALKLYGEGLFFTIKEEILSRWESGEPLGERANDVERRFEATGLHFEHEITVSPRFLFLHTLAHLLIRQLETEAGYPAASLKERIYCTAGRGKMPMSGILIYVAVPDVVGSLGGLAELAVPERFLPLLSGVFDHAEWCSLDPVCSEHEGQGPNLLNRAACHGCALVPEPSCAYGNVLLDRIFIKGDAATGIPAFLDFVD